MASNLWRGLKDDTPSESRSRVGAYPVKYRVGVSLKAYCPRRYRVGSYPVRYRVGAFSGRACDRRRRARDSPCQALPGRWLPCSGSRVGAYPVRYRVTNVQDGRWFVWVLTVIGRKRTKNLFAESPNAHQSPPRRVWRPSGVGGYMRKRKEI